MVKMPLPTSLFLVTSPNGRPASSTRCAPAGAAPARAAKRNAEVRTCFTRAPNGGDAPSWGGVSRKGKMGAAAELGSKRLWAQGFWLRRPVKKPGLGAKSGREESGG